MGSLMVTKMIKEMGLPFAYGHFAEGESPKPPFVVYRYPSSANFVADGSVYFMADRLHIELYTDRKAPDLEERVEQKLDEYELIYIKSENWISSEKMYEVLYETEV